MSDALVAAIAEDPSDPDGYRVYADWLQERGDPRGIFIVLHLERDDAYDDYERSDRLTKEIDAYLYMHHDMLVGSLDDAWSLKWQFGFLRQAIAQPWRLASSDLVAPLTHLLEHPSARFLFSLTLSATESVSRAADLIEVLRAHAPLPLRALWLSMPDDSSVDLSTLWPALPRLEQFVLQGNHDVGTIDLPCLERLSVTGTMLPALLAAHWPKLSELDVDYFAEREARENGFETLYAWLERTDLPCIKILRLAFPPQLERLLEILWSTPVGQQLEELDLRSIQFTSELVIEWAKRPRARRLSRLRIGTTISADARTALAAIAHNVYP